MSIAEKLSTIAENEQTIFNGINTEADLIAEIQSMIDNLPTAGDDDGSYDEGYEEGRKVFWSTYQDNGNRSNYLYAFSNWPEAAFKPMYNIYPTNAQSMLANVSWTCTLPEIEVECGMKFDFSRCTNFNGMLAWNNIKNVGFIDTTACAELNLAFANSSFETMSLKLKNDGSQKMTNTFSGCSKIINLTITEGLIGTSVSFNVAKDLSLDSVQSIIDHLKDLTDQTTQTLTLHADVGAKLTEEQKAQVEAKNWTLAY